MVKIRLAAGFVLRNCVYQGQKNHEWTRMNTTYQFVCIRVHSWLNMKRWTGGLKFGGRGYEKRGVMETRRVLFTQVTSAQARCYNSELYRYRWGPRWNFQNRISPCYDTGSLIRAENLHLD
jgi:hypothetical protein